MRADDGIELAPIAQPGENRAAGAFVWTLCSPTAPETTTDVGGAPVAAVSIASVMQRRSGGEVAALMVDNLGVSTTDEHAEEIESRYEATFAVGLVIGLQVTLALVRSGCCSGSSTVVGRYAGRRPMRRRVTSKFPQDENPALAETGWHPRPADYVYISFTNSIAFSPMDAMPLTRRVKMMMLAESAISATSVLLVATRAVNILR